MDISNVIYLFFLKIHSHNFFLFHFKIKFCWISPKPVTGYVAKKGSHFEKKNDKIIKIYVFDIPKYSFIILYSDN
jgi:hypothetical protein